MANNKKEFKVNPTGNGGKKRRFSITWIYILVLALIIGTYFFPTSTSVDKKVSREKLQKVLLNRDYSKIVVVNQKFAEITINPEAIRRDTMYNDLVGGDSFWTNQKSSDIGNLNAMYIYEFVEYSDFKELLHDVENQWIIADTTGKALSELDKQKIIIDNRINIGSEQRRSWFGESSGFIISTILIIVFWIFIFRMMRGPSKNGGGMGGMFSVGRSKAKLYEKGKNVDVTFSDVAGLEEAKVEIMEIVDFLKNPDKYTKLGGKIPKGALLVGPPGTGKTLLAKAVAGEAKVPFFSMSGSDFVEMFVGVGASRVRDLFENAKSKAPCIVFIDEIDAIGRARGKTLASGANDERENTLNQLLTEMDGFSTNAGVIILAATNRAEILDPALLRAGRFDRQIYVELPGVNERKAIFEVHMKGLKFDKKEINVDFLAKQTPGFSGADIANVCNEAALVAARYNHSIITRQDFLDAIDRIVGGMEKKNKIITPKEKERIAYHEAGHASISWLREFANPLIKVTIIPRGQALGAAWYVPEERQITTKSQLIDQLISLLGGRASEEIVFGEVSTGALNDLERATKMATSMIVYYGLDEQVGNISYYDSSPDREYSFGKPYSEKTAELIDARVRELIDKIYSEAKQILIDNRDKLDKLAKILIDKEVIFREDVEDVYGPRQWEDSIEGIRDMVSNRKETTIGMPSTAETKEEANKSNDKEEQSLNGSEQGQDNGNKSQDEENKNSSNGFTATTTIE